MKALLALLTGLTLAEISAVAGAEPAVPDFNGVYGRDAHNYPKPYMTRGAARNATITGGYNNSILKAWVVEALQRDDMVEKSGHPTITAHSACYPEGVPYVFGGAQVQILQTPKEITMIFGDPGQLRTIYLNQPHSKHVTPGWYGESVGHFEGDELVVDTVASECIPKQDRWASSARRTRLRCIWWNAITFSGRRKNRPHRARGMIPLTPALS